MTEPVFRDYLRKQVLSSCNMEVIDSQSCKLISIMVFEKDKNYISEYTIKRFFKMLPGKDEYTAFVLNSLSHFVGFENWEDFRASVKE